MKIHDKDNSGGIDIGEFKKMLLEEYSWLILLWINLLFKSTPTKIDSIKNQIYNNTTNFGNLILLTISSFSSINFK